jgi:cell division protein FtsZ
MVRPGLINLDFADVETIMKGMGKAMMGTGEAEGENRAEVATSEALNNPLIDEYSLRGAKGLLVNITGGTDLTLFEVDQAVNKIRAEVDHEAELIFGSIEDKNLDGKIRVSIVATALDQQEPEVKPVINMMSRIQNRSYNSYSNFSKPSVSSVEDNSFGQQTLLATEGATALNMEPVVNNNVSENINPEINDNSKQDLNLEENNLLENDDYFQRTYEEENQISDEHITNFEVDSIEEVRPKLLTEEVNVKTHQDDNENSEPSLFENKSFENESNEEEDYEIPAFLRRQKN